MNDSDVCMSVCVLVCALIHFLPHVSLYLSILCSSRMLVMNVILSRQDSEKKKNSYESPVFSFLMDTTHAARSTPAQPTQGGGRCVGYRRDDVTRYGANF